MSSVLPIATRKSGPETETFLLNTKVVVRPDGPFWPISTLSTVVTFWPILLRAAITCRLLNDTVQFWMSAGARSSGDCTDWM